MRLPEADPGDAAKRSSFTSLTILMRLIIRDSDLVLIGWLENQTGDDGNEAFSGSK
jgi:hypothetical protein